MLVENECKLGVKANFVLFLFLERVKTKFFIHQEFLFCLTNNPPRKKTTRTKWLSHGHGHGRMASSKSHCQMFNVKKQFSTVRCLWLNPWRLNFKVWFEKDLHEGTEDGVCMTNHFSACWIHFYLIEKS